MGETIFVELPEPDATYRQDEVFGVVESVKTTSDLLMPVTGKVLNVNEDLADAPELVNKDPYKGGWIIKAPHVDFSEKESHLTERLSGNAQTRRIA